MKYVLLTGLAIFFGVFLIYPLGELVDGAFFINGHFSLAIFYILLKWQLFYGSVENSVFIGVMATVCTCLVSIPLALLFSRYRFYGSGTLQMLMLIPLILPPFVGALGLKHMFARFGMVNLLLAQLGIVPIERPIDWFGGGGLAGVIVLQVLHLFPVLFMSASAALANMDQSLLDAAANLGASPWRRFRTITLPLAMPGFFAGASVVFISAFTDLGTPLIFNLTQAVPVQIFQASVSPITQQAGYALVVMTLAMVMTFFLLIRRFGESNSGLTRPSTSVPQVQLTGFPGFLAFTVVSLLIFMAVLPHIGVVLTSVARQWFFTVLPTSVSGKFYEEVFSSTVTQRCVLNSILYSTLSAGFDLVVGLMIAHLLVREKFIGKSVLDTLAMLPLAVPGLVLAFGLLMSFDFRDGSPTFLQWLNPRKDPTFLLVMSYALRRLPYMVRSAYAGYQQYPVSLEEASYNLGAGRLRTIWKITLPLLAPSLIAGGILTFCYSMLEVSDSLILAQLPRYAPITRGIYDLLGRPTADSANLACAFGVLSMVLLAAGMMLSGRILGRNFSSMFKM